MGQQLFGGSTSSSTPTNTTPPQLLPLRQSTASGLGGLSTFGGIPNYNTQPAALGGNESSLLSRLMGAQQPGEDQINKTLSGYYLPGQPGQNPFLSASIAAAQRPTAQALSDTLSRDLPGQFVAQGGQFVQPNGSSPFAMAAAQAYGRGANALGDIATNIGSNAYTSERTNQQQAIQLSQSDVQNTIANLQAQALPRLIQQYGIDQGLQVFQTRIQSLLQALSTAANPGLINSQGANQQGSSSTGLLPTVASLVPKIGFNFS